MIKQERGWKLKGLTGRDKPHINQIFREMPPTCIYKLKEDIYRGMPNGASSISFIYLL